MPLFRIFRDALHQRLKTLHAFTFQPVELPETGFEEGRNPHTDRMGDFFVRRGHVLGERYLEILGDPLEFHFFHDVDEGNDHTGGSGAPGASRPVDVGFPVVRRLVEEHMGEFGNVNAACGHVRGDEEPDGAFAQPGKDIFAADVDVNELRRQVGMVFQKPNPFPMSIYDNVAYGPRTHGVRNRAKLDEIVEQSLRSAAIWDEVKDRLKKNALGLSGGQQQRLCIARALAVEPRVLLMDEPTSALDPISTSKIEELAMELKKRYTIVIVTHNMQQALRISDRTAFFLLGELIEYDDTEKMFSTPSQKKTEDYITGRFG